MNLKVRLALTGEPDEGDIVDISMTDGKLLTVVCDPHVPFDHYVWHVQSGRQLEETKPLFAMLEERGIEPDWVACYLHCAGGVAVGEPLSLVLVPQGNMPDWPIATTKSVVADIKVR